MKYISINNVVSAYDGCYNKTTNQFWSLVAILKAINTKIEPATSYTFFSEDVSTILDNLFSFGKRNNSESELKWSIMFSNIWKDYMFSNFIKNTPNIYDVAIWLHRKEQFEDGITPEKLLSIFLETIHMNIEDVIPYFNFDIKDIDFEDNLYDEESLKNELSDNHGVVFQSEIKDEKGVITQPEKKTLIFENKRCIQYAAGNFNQAYVQTLYSAQKVQQCLILTKFDFNSLYRKQNKYQNNNMKPEQRIYFGTPGSGKSKKIELDVLPDDEKMVFRTTFHPDTDYSSFVGCYKPQMKDDKIVYAFAPQVFTDAYVAAWNGLSENEKYYLVIEEINRGNCAQIFGDLFQLLDRKKESGYSEYPIKADNDLRDYLEHAKTEDGGQVLINKEGIKDGKLCLPPNLNIIATMNTSDQSLFPMDSAFKRRWSWEYVPIKYDEPKSAAFAINIPDSPFEKWVDFLKKINDIILEKTDSEDKQMGNFFIKGDIEEQEFKDKVMFYLWSEVCKDSFHTKDNFFRTKDREFSYNELYGDKGHDLLLGFLDYIKNYKAKDDQTV